MDMVLVPKLPNDLLPQPHPGSGVATVQVGRLATVAVDSSVAQGIDQG